MLRNTFLGLMAVGTLAACGGSDGLTVSARVGAPRTAGQAAQVQALAAPVAPGITVTRVRMVVARFELVRADTSGTGSGVKGGPFLLDLQGDALDGRTAQVLELTPEPGDYKKIQLGVAKLEDGETLDAPGAADLRARGASVLIDGTVDGQTFTWASSLSVEQEHEALFRLGEGEGNVTLSFDASTWFRSESGERLDPRMDASKSAIEESIKRSIDAFDDDDGDGAEDPGED